MSRIRIANPQPGSAKYTSASRAERYVRCKKAVMKDGELHFLSRAEEWRMNTFIQNSISERRASDVYVHAESCGGMDAIPVECIDLAK